jgi:pimeloyl-ACP methyl ester carboxylesterase
MKVTKVTKRQIGKSLLKLAQLFSLIVLLMLGLGTSNARAAVQTDSTNFEKISCNTFDLSRYAPGAVEGKDVDCGYLIVPERHARPDGPQIKLGIAIIKRTGANSTPSSPLVLTQGGPGGSSIELFLSLAAPANKLGQMLRADRDLIVFEQRGTRYSVPFLFCSELLDLTIRTADQNLSDAEDLRLTRQAAGACHNRLVGQGIDLAAYNSLENADDVASLAQTLGYDQLNFYGVSYGTMLAQHVMRQHPEILRTVILDGIVPLQINPNEQAPVTENRSYTQLFEACAAIKITTPAITAATTTAIALIIKP